MGRVVVAAIVVACGLTACDDAHSTAARWNGNITVVLPARLTSESGNACKGQSDTPWRDIQQGAPVSIRNGAGQVLATWTLPTGAVLRRAGQTGCRFMLTQSTGIESFKKYSLRIASHTLAVPRRNIDGNLFIELPNRQYTRLVPVSGPG